MKKQTFQKIYNMILMIIFIISIPNLSFSLTQQQKDCIILTKEVSKFYKVDDIIPYMAGIESSFGINKIGDNNKSYGIMHVRFSTAKWLLEKKDLHFSDDIIIKFLKDDEFNIMLACTYLRYLLKRFNNKEKAILAYNVGPTNVKKYGLKFDPNNYLRKFYKFKKEIK